MTQCHQSLIRKGQCRADNLEVGPVTLGQQYGGHGGVGEVKVCEMLPIREVPKQGLTLMPSNRDRALSGRRARRVRRALMDATSEY